MKTEDRPHASITIGQLYEAARTREPLTKCWCGETHRGYTLAELPDADLVNAKVRNKTNEADEALTVVAVNFVAGKVHLAKRLGFPLDVVRLPIADFRRDYELWP